MPAGRLLDDARALVESDGARATTRLIRARRASDAIAEEAARQGADLVVVGARRRAPGRREVFGKTVDTVLPASPCRVLVAARGAA